MLASGMPYCGPLMFNNSQQLWLLYQIKPVKIPAEMVWGLMRLHPKEDLCQLMAAEGVRAIPFWGCGCREVACILVGGHIPTDDTDWTQGFIYKKQ